MNSIDEIKAREQSATPGPWEWRTTGDKKAVGVVSPVEVVMCGEIGHFRVERKDAEFIAHARTYIPVLIEQHERDQQQIATLKKALEISCEHFTGQLMECQSTRFQYDNFIQRARQQLTRNALVLR